MVDYSGYEDILVEREGKILKLTLNRPDRMNAVGERLHHELSTIFREINQDDEAWAVTLTGAGRAFCAGGDAGGMASRETWSGARLRSAKQIVLSILDLEAPLVTIVNGAAVGLGATIALLGDVVIASDRARIGDRHVTVGLTAGDGGAVIWPLLVGINRAKELLMTGELIEGERLMQYGIVNHLVPHEELTSFSMAMAERLAGMAPYACRSTKLTLNKLLKQQAETVLDLGLALEWLSMRQEDHQEAAKAWVEKREAQFVGR